MSLSFQFELSDQDLSLLQQAISKSQKAAVGKSDAEVTASARALLLAANDAQVPDFIRSRLNQLDALIAMLGDEAWALPDEDRARVKSAMAYFSEADDLIPDSIPVLGYLDDAIAIELSVRELKHEIEAYSEFCEYREDQAGSRGLEAAKVGRAEWLQARRDELITRMHRRRNLEGSGSYGSSSGYTGGTSYVSNAWRPGLLRVR